LGQGLLCNTGYLPPKLVKAQRATSRTNRPQDEDAPAISDLIEQEAIEITPIGLHETGSKVPSRIRSCFKVHSLRLVSF
jgi:hypothetical protein